jgi:regulation of enolase protein 1 (concanavalin A-like superfamily)
VKKLLLFLTCFAGAALAQAPSNLGVFEGASDVGNPSHKGSVAFDAAKKEYTVTGGGNNIWGNKDDFFFAWRKISGPVIVTADMKLTSDGAPHRKAGLMVRKTLATGSPYADAMVHGSGLTALQWREKADDATRGIQLAVEGPTRIRLERRGNWVTLWASKEGGPLQEWASIQVNLGDPVYVGLAVCPHDDQADVTATFSNVTLEAPPSTPAKKR